MRIVGLILIVLSLPVFLAWLRTRPDNLRWACYAIGILPFVTGWANLDVSVVDWAGWPSYAKGLVVTLLDVLAIAIIVTRPRTGMRFPLLVVLIVYEVAIVLSMAFADLPTASSFYAFQFARVIVVFMAVASIAASPEGMRWLMAGLASGAIFQAIVTVNQRLSGDIQAAGTMGHQNLLGLMLHFVTLPLLAMLLAGDRRKIIILGILAGLVSVALGASRGAVGFVTLGLGLTFIFSLIRRSSAFKWRTAGLGMLVGALLVALSYESFQRRFAVNPLQESTYNERAAFNRAALTMWSDHPMGVGANQYVVVANTQGYSERAGVTWVEGSRSANVHNVYLLIAAETGYIGLASFLLLNFVSLMAGFRAIRRFRDWRGDGALGATVAILVSSLHGFYEWVFMLYPTQYVYAISLGVIAAVLRSPNHVQAATKANTAFSNRGKEITRSSP